MNDLTQSPRKLSSFIDHTLLKPNAHITEYTRLCDEALNFSFFSVCVPPAFVSHCAEILKESPVQVCTVVGFPFGYNTTATKNYEAQIAIDNGADEIDMVMNISALKNGDHHFVIDDIATVVRATAGKIVKVIIETCYLNNEEKRLAVQLIHQAGAQFVKTSTGFGPSGATEDDIQLLFSAADKKLHIKASGGIRDTETALKMINAGAARIGTSQSVTIVGGPNPSDRYAY